VGDSASADEWRSVHYIVEQLDVQCNDLALIVREHRSAVIGMVVGLLSSEAAISSRMESSLPTVRARCGSPAPSIAPLRGDSNRRHDTRELRTSLRSPRPGLHAGLTK